MSKKVGGWIIFIVLVIIAWLPTSVVDQTPEAWLEIIALLIAWGYTVD